MPKTTTRNVEDIEPGDCVLTTMTARRVVKHADRSIEIEWVTGEGAVTTQTYKRGDAIPRVTVQD